MRKKRGWIPFRITKIYPENKNTITFSFVDDEENNVPFDYIPGQYVTFRFDGVREKPLVRSYTLSSAPSYDKELEVTVKAVEKGIISNYLCSELKVGQILKARGPLGKFIYNPEKHNPNLVFIAAGSGVTPFVSIMKEFSKETNLQKPQSMALLTSFRATKDLICQKPLESLKNHFKIHISLSQEQNPDYLSGRVDNKKIADICQNEFQNKTYFLCGPEQMMENGIDFLKAQGVDESQIETESFF